jgi:predicted PurR-regulated permease PerM
LAPSPFAWLERWVERLLLPRFALASLTFLLVAGGLTGVVSGAGAAKQQAQERYLSAVAPNTLH